MDCLSAPLMKKIMVVTVDLYSVFDRQWWLRTKMMGGWAVDVLRAVHGYFTGLFAGYSTSRGGQSHLMSYTGLLAKQQFSPKHCAELSIVSFHLPLNMSSILG
jgi:hypothetical protein